MIVVEYLPVAVAMIGMAARMALFYPRASRRTRTGRSA
jgi:hypothetical protein